LRTLKKFTWFALPFCFQKSRKLLFQLFQSTRGNLRTLKKFTEALSKKTTPKQKLTALSTFPKYKGKF